MYSHSVYERKEISIEDAHETQNRATRNYLFNHYLRRPIQLDGSIG